MTKDVRNTFTIGQRVTIINLPDEVNYLATRKGVVIANTHPNSDWVTLNLDGEAQKSPTKHETNNSKAQPNVANTASKIEPTATIAIHWSNLKLLPANQ